MGAQLALSRSALPALRVSVHRQRRRRFLLMTQLHPSLPGMAGLSTEIVQALDLCGQAPVGKVICRSIATQYAITASIADLQGDTNTMFQPATTFWWVALISAAAQVRI
jgi:hypothetical protein